MNIYKSRNGSFKYSAKLGFVAVVDFYKQLMDIELAEVKLLMVHQEQQSHNILILNWLIKKVAWGEAKIIQLEEVDPN